MVSQVKIYALGFRSFLLCQGQAFHRCPEDCVFHASCVIVGLAAHISSRFDVSLSFLESARYDRLLKESLEIFRAQLLGVRRNREGKN